VDRLRQAFHAIDEPAVPRRTHRAWGVVEEAASASELADRDVRDAALLAGLLAVKHYELGRYGALVAWADEMAHEEAADLLRNMLRETKATEQALRSLAQIWIGRAAIAA
jgi:ferritin-like metal-binding protein YciE